jgi:hypothetical protein
MIHSELLAYCPAPGVITTADEYSPQFGSIPDDKASEDHTVPGVQIHAIYGLLFQEVVALQ